MKRKALGLLIMLICTYTKVYSQFDNSFFDADKYETKIDSGNWLFHFDNLNYFRNTEQTSLVDKGVTYIGFHLQPYVQYSFNNDAELYAGLFLRYDFGNPQIKTLEPYFKFKHKLWGHDIIFGSLEGAQQHQLTEPLCEYELAVTDRYETGAQIRKKGKVLEYDTWIDWYTMIYEDDPFNEEFFAGINAWLHILNNDKNKLSLNGEAITVHAAGEIDKSPIPNSIEYNFSYGLQYTHRFNEHTELYMAGHAAFYEDRSNELATGYYDGLGQLGIVRLKHKEYQFVLNYWNGDQFQAPRGEQLYHSRGNRNFRQPFSERQMVGFRLAFEKEIAKNLTLLSRNGVNYNIDHNKTDIIMETYLRWHFTNPKSKLLKIR